MSNNTQSPDFNPHNELRQSLAFRTGMREKETVFINHKMIEKGTQINER
jgi:hypothetical protein